MRRVFATFGLLLAGALLPAHALEPERTVAGHIVNSTHDPKIEITLPATANYLGADRWILGGYDDCEMHLFAESDAHQEITHFYWVQFEAYVPEHPEAHHNYSGSRQITWHGMDFYLDTWVQSSSDPVTPDSDEAHAHAMMAAKGLRLPTNGMYVRLVHLPDAEKRHEVMIIYAEDLAPTGFTAAQLGKHGDQRKHWPDIEKALIQRAMTRISVQP